MHSPDRKYKYEIWNKNGTYYKSDLPPREESWSDRPALHLFFSYSYTFKGIVKAYWRGVKSVLS